MNIKWKRRLSILILSVMMVSILPMVPGIESSAGRKQKTKTKVAIINADKYESGYRMANVNDFKKVFKSKKKYKTYYSYGSSDNECLKSASSYIDKGVDYLVINGNVGDNWKKMLKHAKSKGIKIILFDLEPYLSKKYYDALVVTDMKAAADIAVKWLEKQNLLSYKILHLQGTLGSPAQYCRSKALEEGIQKNGWECVASKCAEWNVDIARNIVADYIECGCDFNIIYAENDDMAYGAEKALDDAGISHGLGGDVIIISFDAARYALNKVFNGDWNFEVQLNPFMAKDVFETIKKLEAGKSIPRKTVIVKDRGFDTSTITIEDVNKYGI